MSSGVDPDNIEAEALWLLQQLASRYGVAMVQGIVEVLTGGGGGLQIVEALSGFVAGVVRDVLGVLDADRVRAELAAAFEAANAVADAAEAAKFGPP